MTIEQIQKMSPAQLSALYVDWIGYDPLAEGATVEEVREVLIEYVEEGYLT